MVKPVAGTTAAAAPAEPKRTRLTRKQIAVLKRRAADIRACRAARKFAHVNLVPNATGVRMLRRVSKPHAEARGIAKYQMTKSVPGLLREMINSMLNSLLRSTHEVLAVCSGTQVTPHQVRLGACLAGLPGALPPMQDSSFANGLPIEAELARIKQLLADNVVHRTPAAPAGSA